jgi:parvulin-like peptidyl-prolyl isomerase
MNAARATEVARFFGNEFVEELSTAEIGGWRGPLRSEFGVHLVELTERRDGGRATLHDVRAEVERDLLHARSEDAKAAMYEKLRARYNVRFDNASTASSPGG